MTEMMCTYRVTAHKAHKSGLVVIAYHKEAHLTAGWLSILANLRILLVRINGLYIMHLTSD